MSNTDTEKYYKNIDLQGNQINNGTFEKLASAPSNPFKGQHYFNTTTNVEYVYNGSAWVNASVNVGNYYTKDEIGSDFTSENTVKDYIDTKTSSVYRYKGSVQKYSNLPTEGNVQGDVWNIVEADTEHGIRAGDNVAWVADVGSVPGHWDVIGGITDLSNYYNKTEIGSGFISGEVTSLKQYIDNQDTSLGNRLTTAEGDIDTLETKVSTIESDLNTTGTGLKAKVSALETTVGDSTSGLVKQVADNKSDISTINTKIGDNTSTPKTGMYLMIATNANDIDSLETRATTLENKMGNGFDTSATGTVTAKVQALRDELDTANTGVKARITTIETDLNTAETGLKARVTTAEGDIDDLEEEVGSDTTSGSIKYRIKTLEDDLNTTSTGLKARMTTAETDIDNIESAIGSDTTSGTIKYRIKTNETAIADLDDTKAEKTDVYKKTEIGGSFTEESTLKDYVDDADTTISGNLTTLSNKVNDTTTGLDTKASQTALTALTTRVTTAEGDIDTLQDDLNDEETGLKARVTTIEGKIPAEASSTNQLADKEFVNSSIATSTATFRGTYNSVSELPTTGVDENDYAFVKRTDATGNQFFDRYKYTNKTWLFEYTLNNTSFTAVQWAAINSGLAASDKTSYDAHVADTDIHVTTANKTYWNNKQEVVSATTPVNFSNNTISIDSATAGADSSSALVGVVKLYTAQGDNEDGAMTQKQSKAEIATLNTTISTGDSTTLSTAKTYTDAETTRATGIENGLNTRLTTAESDIDTIEGKIPSAASTTNQLADKTYVVAQVDLAFSYMRGSFQTKALIPTDYTEYDIDLEGNRKPDKNDYIIIKTDEEHEYAATRYLYRGTWDTDGVNGWKFLQYESQMSFTEGQWNAINSGITSAKISSIDSSIATNTTNITNLQTSVSDKVSTSTFNTALAAKQDTLSNASVLSTIRASDITQIGTNKDNITSLQSSKQDAFSESKLEAINALTLAKVNKIDTIDTISAVIPSTATSSNMLVATDTLNSAIVTATANFRGAWATWSAVPTEASSYPADASGNKTPTSNDYMVVTADENLEHGGATWRYKYVGTFSQVGKGGWQAEYEVSETPLTGTVIKSKLTSAEVASIESGITSSKVSTYDGYATTLAGKQDTLTTAQQSAVDSGITSTLVATFNAKQNALTDAQLLAVNSGITAVKVAKYDGYETDIAGKQATLTTEQLAAVNSGIDSTKVTQINTNTTNIATIGTDFNTGMLKTLYDGLQGKQATLTATQLSAVNSGVTETLVSKLNDTLPSSATSSNKLATMSDLQTAGGRCMGSFANMSAVTFIYPDASGKTHPVQNDYMILTSIVLNETISNNPTQEGEWTMTGRYPSTAVEGETWFFKYTGTWDTDYRKGWTPEYRINETAFTQAQLDAINSGITSALVGIMPDPTTIATGDALALKSWVKSGAASTVIESYLTDSRNKVGGFSDESNPVITKTNITVPQLNKALDGFDASSSSIQTQLNGKIGSDDVNTFTKANTFTSTLSMTSTPSTSTATTQVANTSYVKQCVPVSVGDSYTPVYTNDSGVITKGAYSFKEVDELPASPDANTFYFVEE